MKIDVNAVDVARAYKNDSYHCVVAQAIARKLPHATHIEVDTQSIRFSMDGERRVYLTPWIVQGYVIAFDAGDPIEPFTFSLQKPTITKRRTRTAVGLAAHKAAREAREAARKKVAKAPAAKAPPKKKVTSPKAKREVDPREAAKIAYKKVVEAHPGQPQSVTSSPGRRAVPRVFKARKRTYGSRLLRINQEELVES